MPLPPLPPSLRIPALQKLVAWRGLALLGQIMGWVGAGVAAVMLALWLVIYLLIVPRIDDFRPFLEARLSQAMGVSLRIGSISASVQGVMPTFAMQQVRLLDQQGSEVLALKKVTASLSPQSLLNFGFEQLLIEQPELAIRRNKEGRIFIAGFDLLQDKGALLDTSVQADWLFSQEEIVIRSGKLNWRDETRAAPQLSLTQVDLVLRNSGRRHMARLDATPEASWGSRFTLVGDFRSALLGVSAGDWRQWRGQLYANLPFVDVRQLRQYANLGVDLEQGSGALRAWANWDRGALTQTTVDAALSDVVVAVRDDLQPLAMNTLAGRFGLRLDANDFEFSTEQLRFEMPGGLVWPAGNFRFALTNRQEVARATGALSADQLDLAALAQISNRLPIDLGWRKWIQNLQAQGRVEKLSATWHGPIEQPTAYAVQGQVRDLQVQSSPIDARVASNASSSASSSVAAHDGVWHPGVRHATIHFKLTQAGGTGQVQIDKGSLTLPGIFEQPLIALDEFSAELRWRINGDHIQVDLPAFKFANADAQGEGKVSWQTADPNKNAAKSRFPGILDLQGSLARAQGNQVHRYLPLVLPERARDYVRDAVREGQASQGRFKVKGDLSHMPFADASQGEFLISAQVRDVVFDYVPSTTQAKDDLPWPALTQINGELIFERQSMTVRSATARVLGASNVLLSNVQASIAQLGHDAQVDVSAQLRGEAADILGMVNSSALATLSKKVLAQASMTGSTDLKLRMSLPIANIKASRVQASATLNNHQFQLSPDSPQLTRLRGQVHVSESDFRLQDVSAWVFGGAVRLTGQSYPLGVANKDLSASVRAQGFATAEGLRQATQLGMLSQIAARATGGAAYEMVLNVRRGVPEIVLTSSLQGLALNLPQPLAKSADSVMPIRYENVLAQEETGSAKRRDWVRLKMDSLVDVSYLRDISAAVPVVIRGRIGVGLAPGEAIYGRDEDVVAANINFRQIDLQAWEALLSAATPNLAPSASAPLAMPSGIAAQAMAYVPTVLSIRAQELGVLGRTLHNVVAGVSREGLIWRANIDSREMGGYLEYRQATAKEMSRVYARLARLSIAAAAVSDIEASLEQAPRSIPALDIIVEDLDLLGRNLGRLELEAINREANGVREWRLNRLNLKLPEAQLSGTGNWALLGAAGGAARNNRSKTVLDFKLDISNAGELLKRFGQDKVVSRGSGTMQGQVAWLGTPWSMDAAGLSGGFSLNVEGGQFLKADPGLGKLLGVLSLQSLPRRLTLDFRDVFSEGFAFDFIRGDVQIEQGVARTNNLQMKGVSAAVLLEGQAHIPQETQDIKVVIVPELNAGTASLVASAINPAIGIGTFLAQLILRKPVIDAATQEFRVTGSWSDPKVENIKRNKPTAPAKESTP